SEPTPVAIPAPAACPAVQELSHRAAGLRVQLRCPELPIPPTWGRQGARCCETRIGHRVCDLFGPQSYGTEKIIPGDLFGSGYIFGEEPAQVCAAHGLSGFANSFRIVEETAFLR